MSKMCKLFLSDGRKFEVPIGTHLLEIEKKYYDKYPHSIMAFKVNHEIKDLNFEINTSEADIEPVDVCDKDGVRIYQRSLVFVFARAVRETMPNAKTRVEHSLSKGLFCEIIKDTPLTEQELSLVEEKMRKIISKDEPFVLKKIPKEEAKKTYLELGLNEKANLLEYRKDRNVKVYEFGTMKDYYYGYMLPSSGKLKEFELKYYNGGLIIRHPTPYSKGKLPIFEEHAKLSKVHRESERWGEVLGVDYISNVNDKIVNKSINSTILTVEALHEKKIIEIADEITRRKSRIILIAGPSSSGKTTFANRLKIQLSVNGINAVALSVDDYFVDREFTPRDENGEYDFECIEAIDRKRFNSDLLALLRGENVTLPYFDFKLGKRKETGHDLKVDETHPLIIEGIHCLNPKLTEDIEDSLKFRIYISCLTQLNIDEHNRIPTTDSRLIRRLVRDMKHRGNDGLTTLKLWSSVRRGEEKNIFPFQETADVMFNSATVYELSALKKYVEPILRDIPEDVDEITEAKRLLKFLRYVISLEDEKTIPNTAIIREFIGGSVFR